MSDGMDLIGLEEARVEFAPVSALAAMNRSELETQVDCAHKYARSTKRFLQEATTLATLTREIAESCIYALPRGGKTISGPSVRLAEIVASAYGNLMVAARVIDVTDKEVIAQGIAWDIEKNLRVMIETRRRITNKSGNRFDDDMITVTGNAAASIALRNAIFRVVPRAYVDVIYTKARAVAVGDATTLAARRDDVVNRLVKMGATPERIFGAVNVKGIDDVTIETLETLIGFGSAIKAGERTVDECFPSVTFAAVPTSDAPEGRRMSLKKKDAPPVALVAPPVAPPVAHDADGVVIDVPEPGTDG